MPRAQTASLLRKDLKLSIQGHGPEESQAQGIGCNQSCIQNLCHPKLGQVFYISILVCFLII